MSAETKTAVGETGPVARASAPWAGYVYTSLTVSIPFRYYISAE
jgi:hypothetical protein